MSGAEDQASVTSGTEPDEELKADRTDLDDLPDGAGCAEIWDYLSNRRGQD